MLTAQPIKYQLFAVLIQYLYSILEEKYPVSTRGSLNLKAIYSFKVKNKKLFQVNAVIIHQA